MNPVNNHQFAFSVPVTVGQEEREFPVYSHPVIEEYYMILQSVDENGERIAYAFNDKTLQNIRNIGKLFRVYYNQYGNTTPEVATPRTHVCHPSSDRNTRKKPDDDKGGGPGKGLSSFFTSGGTGPKLVSLRG